MVRPTYQHVIARAGFTLRGVPGTVGILQRLPAKYRQGLREGVQGVHRTRVRAQGARRSSPIIFLE